MQASGMNKVAQSAWHLSMKISAEVEHISHAQILLINVASGCLWSRAYSATQLGKSQTSMPSHEMLTALASCCMPAIILTVNSCDPACVCWLDLSSLIIGLQDPQGSPLGLIAPCGSLTSGPLDLKQIEQHCDHAGLTRHHCCHA